jgi:hypothetical protein
LLLLLLFRAGALDFWYSHAMIGEESYTALKQNCDFSVIG